MHPRRIRFSASAPLSKMAVTDMAQQHTGRGSKRRQPSTRLKAAGGAAPPAHPPQAAKPFRPTMAMRTELANVLAEIEVAVTTCVGLRRWSDLEAAVSSYALMMGVDPCLLLHTAFLRPMVRRAMTLTDPAAVAEYASHIAAALELSKSGMQLHDAVELLRLSVEHAGAFAMFDAIHTTPPNAEVH